MRRNKSFSETEALEKFRHYLIAKKLPFITEIYRDFSYADEPLMWLFHAELDVPHKEKILGANAEGFSFSDPNSALVKCLGEAVERYFSFCPVEQPKFYSIDQLVKKQMQYVLPEYSNDLELEIKEKTLLPSTKIGWYLGNTHTEQVVALPAQTVSLSYIRNPNEGFLAPSISTGTASHTTKVDAKLHGLYEVIERDAFMCAFLTKAFVPQVDLASIPELQKYDVLSKQYNFELRVFDITTNLEVPCFFALLIDRTGYGPAITVGAKAHHSSLLAIEGCILEAYHPRPWLRSIWMSSQTQKYSQLIRPEDIHTLSDRGKFWAEQIRIAYFDYLPSQKTNVKRNLQTETDITSEQRLTRLEQQLAKKGHPVYWANLTPKEFGKDFFIFKAIVPSLQPLYLEEQFPVFQKTRLKEMSSFYQDKKYLSANWSWANQPHPFL